MKPRLEVQLAAACSHAPSLWLQEARHAKSETMSLCESFAHPDILAPFVFFQEGRVRRPARFRRDLKAERNERLPFPPEPRHAILRATCMENVFEHGKKESLRPSMPVVSKS